MGISGYGKREMGHRMYETERWGILARRGRRFFSFENCANRGKVIMDRLEGDSSLGGLENPE